MVSRNYERFQLELIARDYSSRGYSVMLEWLLPNTNFRFDAVARRESDNSMVVIEVVNASRSEFHLQQRRAAFEQLARDYPTANIDLRYIDPGLPAWATRITSMPRDRQALLNAVFEFSTDRFRPASSVLLGIWGHIAAQLRAYGRLFDKPLDEGAADILTLYNNLLASEKLQAPDVVVDGVDLDFAQLFAIAVAAMQGAPVTEDEVVQMLRHLVSIHEQVSTRMPRPH